LFAFAFVDGDLNNRPCDVAAKLVTVILNRKFKSSGMVTGRGRDSSFFSAWVRRGDYRTVGSPVEVMDLGDGYRENLGVARLILHKH